MTALEFLQILYGGLESGYVYLWQVAKPHNKTYWYSIDDLPKMASDAVKLSKNHTIYYGIAGLNHPGAKNERVKNANANFIPGFALDIDLMDAEAHAGKNYPLTYEDALKIIHPEFQPTHIVHSGYGLHFYWLFREAWIFDTPEERNQAQQLSTNIRGDIKSRAAQYGWTVDPTQDLARVLRLPETLNHKKDVPKPVQVILNSNSRYNPSDFNILPDYFSDSSSNNPAKKFTPNPADGPAIYLLHNCMFIQKFTDLTDKIPEPEWFAMCTNVSRCRDGESVIHDLIRPVLGSKYNSNKTQKKILHSKNDNNPHTCEYICKQLGFDGCPPGGCGVKAPIGWATGKLPRARAVTRMTATTAEAVFRPEVIAAVAMLEQNDPNEYSIFKSRIKGKINTNDLNKAIKKHNQETKNHLDIIHDKSALDVLKDAPINLKIPSDWLINPQGVQFIERRNTGDRYHRASHVPVILSGRVFNVDTRIEKIEISFKRGKKWRKIVLPKSVAFNSRKIVDVADEGLNVSSETAKYLVKWFDDLEGRNMNDLPIYYAVSKMGWHGDNIFFPGAEGQLQIDLDDDGEVSEGFNQRGSLTEWVEISQQVRQYPMARFMLAAAFAAPLLKILNHRTFMVYLWGTSGGGKTAGISWAMSVWGPADKLMVNFNTTKTGIERRAALTSDLPMAINERQVAGGGKDQQGWLENVIYLLGEGKGKLRGTRTGIQKTASWRTIALATGEEPISKESSAQGVKTRVLELNSYPVVDNELAKKLHINSKIHCGIAGKEFIRKLIDNQDIGSGYHDLQNVLTGDFPRHFTVHIDAVALVCLADCLVSQWLFNIPEKQAEQEAYDLARFILNELPIRSQISDVERGWDFVQNWLAANHSRFEISGYESKSIGPVYGFKKDGKLCVYPEPLSKAMQDAGFSPEKLLREFANADKIETTIEDGKRRFKISTRYNGHKIRVVVIKDE